MDQNSKTKTSKRKTDTNRLQKSGQQSVTTRAKTVCKYPNDPKDVSANWKRLAQQLSQTRDKRPKVKKVVTKESVEKPTTFDKNKIWFDGVDKCLIKSSMVDSSADERSQKLVKDKSFSGLTKIVAMDCEMVGTGPDGTTSMLARVSIVNFFGHCIYDKFVKPMEEVTDYRTAVSGVRPSDLVTATDFRTVQKEVHQILKDRLVVGHAVSNDFKALLLSHPKHKIRDTSKYFRKLLGGPKPSLKKLSETLLGVKVQTGEHDSVEDARATMRLFTMYRRKWEAELVTRSRTRMKRTN